MSSRVGDDGSAQPGEPIERWDLSIEVNRRWCTDQPTRTVFRHPGMKVADGHHHAIYLGDQQTEWRRCKGALKVVDPYTCMCCDRKPNFGLGLGTYRDEHHALLGYVCTRGGCA